MNKKGRGNSVPLRTLHYFWMATRKAVRFFLLDILSTFGFVALLTYLNNYYMGKMVDMTASMQVEKGQVFAVFGPYICILVLVNAVGQLCSKLQDYAVWKLEICANYELASYCFDTLSNQSMTFHSNRYGGALVSQTSKFMSAYSLLLETFTYSLMPTCFSVLMTVVMLAPRVPVYVCILVGMLVFYTAAAYFMYRRTLAYNASAASAQNDLSGELSDAVANILSVKTYGREDYEKRLFESANERVVQADSLRMRSSNERGAVTSSIIVLIMALVTVFLAGGNAWFGVSAGTLVMMFTYTYSLTMHFNMINSMLQRLNRAFGDAAGMTAILDEPRLVEDKPGAVDLVVTKGEIEFVGLNFRYEDADGTDDVFREFSLRIPAGQRVGLVGRSGAGKTTLTKLLLRLSDIQEGQILVDGQEISSCTQKSLRSQIAYVPQEGLLFHRSIRDNIAYGRPDASEEQIREAARLANALEFIEQLPDGMDTMVGERGIKLSGGQRQRVSIARAILADTPILVLDEATSALDSESEKLVQDALSNLMRGRTSIVVAHRLSTVASLDRIIVIKDGKVFEDGSHEELLRLGGEYATLWNRQSGMGKDLKKC
ncbi:MAG: ABC transporter ATP-binding protein [Lachnospiraceae bacterium]|nr:ABC transporter ATP-binding protein [Lachnospiraceae bacterium]